MAAKTTPNHEAPTSMPAALQEVFFCISRAFYAYISCLEELLVKNNLAKHLRPGMGHVLFDLFDHDDVIIKNIVDRTELSPSTLTRILTDMERRGLIVRRRDKHDGRATRVRLTRLGRSLEGRCNQTLADVHRIICGDLPQNEIDGVVHGLTQMIENLRRGTQRSAASASGSAHAGGSGRRKVNGGG